MKERANRAASFALDDAATLVVAAPPSVVIVGNFDGVHLGHRAVLADAVALGVARSLVPAVLTFDPHPGAVVGSGAPPLLTTMPRRAELLGAAGIARVYLRRFDVAFAAWSPSQFVRDLLSAMLNAKVVMVGENFRFGAKRAGDLAMLAALGRELGFEVRPHALVKDAVGPLSSTRARMNIAAGDVEAAATVLGRPHSLSGIVARGAQRGRTIGFPTANLEQVPEMLPPDGVYAVVVDELTGEGDELAASALGRGVMNIGVRPTLAGENARTLEAHLFDFARDLYGARLRVHVVARLRDERRFASLDALKAQIADDAREARARTAALEPDPSRGAFG